MQDGAKAHNANYFSNILNQVIEGKLKVTYGRLHGFWTQIPLIAVCGEP
jgi:hypothetical protein